MSKTMTNTLVIINDEFTNWLENNGLNGKGYKKNALQSLLARLRHQLERFIPTEYGDNIGDFYDSVRQIKANDYDTSTVALCHIICQLWVKSLEREADRDYAKGGIFVDRIKSVITAVKNLDLFICNYAMLSQKQITQKAA